MLYSAEVRSRNNNTPNNGNIDGLDRTFGTKGSNSYASKKLLIPKRKKTRKGKDYNCNKCLCLCFLLTTICCFSYIHFFIVPIDKNSLGNIQQVSSDVAEHVKLNLKGRHETKLQSTVKKLNSKSVISGSVSSPKSLPFDASNAFKNPHSKTDEEIEDEAMRETIAEWKERDGFSDEGRFKTFKKYKGRHHRPDPGRQI